MRTGARNIAGYGTHRRPTNTGPNRICKSEHLLPPSVVCTNTEYFHESSYLCYSPSIIANTTAKMSIPPFNVLQTNAVELQQLLAASKITSVQIVQEYFAQIDRHESALNAFISLAPRNKVLRAAAALDEERQRGSIRSPLHGIPIALKVPIHPNPKQASQGRDSLGQ